MNSPVASKTSGPKALLRFDVPLSRYSTIQIGGNARFFAEPSTLEELQKVLHFAREERAPVLGIGKGSNVLFPDEGYSGLVITFIHYEPSKILCDRENQTVTASAGVSLYRLALATQNAGLGGAEFLSHIPGTLGGALMMNAGFSRSPEKKMEIGEIVEEVTALTPEGEVRTLGRGELRFGYRKSSLEGQMILAGRLKLRPSATGEVRAEIQESFGYRNRVQDLRYPSLGSVFKNQGASQGSSGQLIEKAGLKGRQIGGAKFSDKHANFIINVGGARAADVLELIKLAQEKVREKFGVPLEPEIRIIRNPQ